MNLSWTSGLPSRLPARIVAGLAIAFAACFPASAQTLLDCAGLLGMSREQLASKPALADVQSVRSPRRLSSGALGLLRVPSAQYEGAHFEETLFFAHQKLEQMEFVWISPVGDTNRMEAALVTTQSAMLRSLRAQLGPELAAFGGASAAADSASWVSSAADADVMLFRSGTAGHPSLRLVIKQRQVADASEL